jgi:plasmid stabilization system protein ParE
MSDPKDADDGEPMVYAIRIAPRARREAMEAALWLAEQTGDADLAREWQRGLDSALATLATNPQRFVVLPRETRLFGIGRDIRRLLYRRTPDSAAYLVFYTVAETSDDGPRVSVIHIRHASRRPLTPKEARALREES